MLASQIASLLSQTDRASGSPERERSRGESGDGCTQCDRGRKNGSPGSGGTRGSTQLRLLFGHAPSDHDETVVIMRLLYSSALDASRQDAVNPQASILVTLKITRAAKRPC